MTSTRTLAAPPATADAAARPARIAVCIATYRRPHLLAFTLQSLRDLTIPAGCTVQVRVVDNDEQGSAAAVAARFADLDLHYAIEPERSIALARNRALELGSAEFVAFLDDDEIARPDWLVALHDRLTTLHADAAFGPVRGALPLAAPRWIRDSRLFDKPVGVDRAGRVPWTATRTANALVHGAWFFEHGLRFDPAFGRSGGEDTDLFRRMEARGARFAAAREAVVEETIHESQCRLGWFVRRHLRGGFNYERQMRSPAAVVLVRAAKRVVLGTLRAVGGVPAALLGRPDRCCRGLLELARAVGGLHGWLRPDAAARDGYSSSGTLPPDRSA